MDHGQPINPFFNRQRRIDRDVSELLGLAKGLLADGIVVEQEVTRLKQFFADNVIDERERLELRDILAELVGGKITMVMGCEGSS